MRRMRNGLLMITIVALIMPAPIVGASDEPVATQAELISENVTLADPSPAGVKPSADPVPSTPDQPPSAVMSDAVNSQPLSDRAHASVTCARAIACRTVDYHKATSRQP